MLFVVGWLVPSGTQLREGMTSVSYPLLTGTCLDHKRTLPPSRALPSNNNTRWLASSRRRSSCFYTQNPILQRDVARGRDEPPHYGTSCHTIRLHAVRNCATQHTAAATTCPHTHTHKHTNGIVWKQTRACVCVVAIP